MKSNMFKGCLLVIALAACGKKNSTNDDVLNSTDTNYMAMTSASNNAEIDAANLASTKATNTAVKAFAQHMIMEHSMAQTDLKTLGTSVGYPVKDSIDPAHVAIKAQLSLLSGRQFDSTYIYGQVTDHQTVVKNFQNELSNGQNIDVKNYANTNLPHIQMHLQSADSIANAYFHK